MTTTMTTMMPKTTMMMVTTTTTMTMTTTTTMTWHKRFSFCPSHLPTWSCIPSQKTSRFHDQRNLKTLNYRLPKFSPPLRLLNLLLLPLEMYLQNYWNCLVVRALRSPACSIDLVERDILNGVDLILDPFTAIIFVPLLMLPSQCESVVQQVSYQSWPLPWVFRSWSSRRGLWWCTIFSGWYQDRCLHLVLCRWCCPSRREADRWETPLVRRAFRRRFTWTCLQDQRE